MLAAFTNPSESGWDGVNFIHSSQYGTVVLICDQNNVDNSSVLPFGEPCLHSMEAFSFCHSVTLSSVLAVCKKLGGYAAGTAGPNLPKEYSILSDIMLGNNSCEKEGGAGNIWSHSVCIPK